MRGAGAVLQIFLRAIRTMLRRTSPGAPPDARLGAVSFFHRFGSSLNSHPHYHVVVLDGVFGEAGDGEIQFHEASKLTPDSIRQLEPTLQRRFLRYFRRHGLLDELDAVGMLSWQGSGGFSVDASVQGEDRAGASSASVPGRPSLSNGCTRSTPSPPSRRPRAASSTASPNPTSTAAPSCCSRPSSSSTLSPNSSRPRASIVTVTTESWRRMPGCGPKSSRSVGPNACPRSL